jgi:hypothetical protein
MFIPSVLDRINRSRDEAEIVTLWKLYRASNGNPTLFDLDAAPRARVAKALISKGLLTLVKGKGLVYADR